MKFKFIKAKARLYEEMDLLKLIKALRFAKFLSASNLDTHHWHMIGNFDQYCIKDEEDDSNHSSCSDECHDRVVDANDPYHPGHADDDSSHDKISYYG